MPAVKPFHGLLYSSAIPIARVVTQPYDKISARMQEAYARRHPSNFVHLILDKIRPSDDAKNNRYARAAERLDRWVKRDVLQRDEAPAFYLYEQTFQRDGFGQRSRRGIIGLLRLEDFSRGNVLPHERTLAKPRKDRLSLLAATQANLEQIFLLCDDTAGKLEQTMRAQSKTKPVLDFKDEDGVRQRLWKISDRVRTRHIAGILSKGKLFIADGHHRYTISLAYHKKLAASRRVSPALKENSGWRMATFVPLQSPGLVILPTHRLVSVPVGFDHEALMDALQKDFFVEMRPAKKGLPAAAADLAVVLRARRNQGTVFGLLTQSYAAILRLRASSSRVRQELVRVLAQPFRKLDVAILHRLILEKQLGINPKSVEQGERIAYSREPEELARKIATGEFAMGFLQNPPDIEQVKSIALAGECMPQKSTDFYPKLLSGLVMYDMKDRAARRDT